MPKKEGRGTATATNKGKGKGGLDYKERKDVAKKCRKEEEGPRGTE